MRKIKFDVIITNDRFSIVESDHLYIIYLPNKAKPQFSNKKKMKVWLIESENMFTDMFYELNEIFINIYSNMRMLFFNLSDKELRDFESLADGIKYNIVNAFRSSTLGTNGIHYVEKDAQNAIANIRAFGLLFEKKNLSLKNNQAAKRMKPIYERLVQMERLLKLWGWDYTQPHTRFKEINISKYENDYFKDYPIY